MLFTPRDIIFGFKFQNMYKIIPIIFIIISSCGLQRAASGTTEKDLIKQVSIEKNCPRANIKIIEKHRTAGNGTYALSVCGNRVVYSLVGSVFIESSKKDNLLKNIKSKK